MKLKIYYLSCIYSHKKKSCDKDIHKILVLCIPIYLYKYKIIVTLN